MHYCKPIKRVFTGAAKLSKNEEIDGKCMLGEKKQDWLFFFW